MASRVHRVLAGDCLASIARQYGFADWRTGAPFTRVARQQPGTRVLEVSAEVFESISAKEGPQGIGAVIRQRWDRLEAIPHVAASAHV